MTNDEQTLRQFRHDRLAILARSIDDLVFRIYRFHMRGNIARTAAVLGLEHETVVAVVAGRSSNRPDDKG